MARQSYKFVDVKFRLLRRLFSSRHDSHAGVRNTVPVAIWQAIKKDTKVTKHYIIYELHIQMP